MYIFRPLVVLLLLGIPVQSLSAEDNHRVDTPVISQELVSEIIAIVDGASPPPPVTTPKPNDEHLFWVKSKSDIKTTLSANLKFKRASKVLSDATPSKTATQVKESESNELESLDVETSTQPKIDEVLSDDSAPVSQFFLNAFINKDDLILRHSYASQPKERHGVSVPLLTRQSFLLNGGGGSSLLIFSIPKVREHRGALICPVNLVGRQAWEDVDVLGNGGFELEDVQFSGGASVHGSFRSGVNPGKALVKLLASKNIVESKVYQDQGEGRTPSADVVFYRTDSKLKVGKDELLTAPIRFEGESIGVSLGGEVVLTGPAEQQKITRRINHLKVISIDLKDERSIELKGRRLVRLLPQTCWGVFEAQEASISYQNAR